MSAQQDIVFARARLLARLLGTEPDFRSAFRKWLYAIGSRPPTNPQERLQEALRP